MTPIQKIIVVGAGTSGWLTASAIKKQNPDIDVTIVHDSKIPTVGVGETLTFRMPYFMKQVLGLNDDDWMPKCQATYKSGVKWLDWKNQGDIHRSSSIDEFPAHEILSNTYINNSTIPGITGKNLPGLENPDLLVTDLWYSMFRAGMLGNNVDDIQAALSDEYYFSLHNKSIRNLDGSWLTHQQNGFSYHYNAEVVSNVVGDLVGRPCGVKEIDSHITDVVFDQQNIKHLVLASGEHIHADMFIDCSGFKRLLMSKMENKWIASDEYFNNSALVKQVQYDNTDHPQHQISNSTTFAALSSGWRFSIPLQNRSGNGYIFNKDITPDIDQLASEFNTALDNTNECRLIQWSPGRWKDVVSHNCMSVGLSLGFSDPFDANNLTLTINIIEQLSTMLKDPRTNNLYIIRKELNKVSSGYWEDVSMRVRSALRLSPKTDTKYYQILSQAAKDQHLLEEFVEYVETARQKTISMNKLSQFKPNLWQPWSYTTLAMRYGIDLPCQQFDPELAEVAKQYFKLRMAKNKLLAERAPHIRDFYREYFKSSV